MAKASGRINMGQSVFADAVEAKTEPEVDFRGFGVGEEGEKAIEDTVEGVLKAEVEAEVSPEPPKVEEPKVPEFAKPAFIADKHLVRQLRKNDPPNKRTCGVCKTRVHLHKIGFGHAEICDDCK